MAISGVTPSLAATSDVASLPYEWSSVPVVGGGFVDGIICHPSVEGLRYCRTDMGGAYRWNDTLKCWIPLLDWLSEADANLQGVESIALDPNHPERVYMACGTYTTLQGSILRSDDYGKTFRRTDVPILMGGNEGGRGNGERMMVDPKNDNVIYFGTRLNGLWRSVDRGVSWEKVTSFPDIKEKFDPRDRGGWMGINGCGVNGVVFVGDAKLDAGNDVTQTIYVSCSQREHESLFVSNDGGGTWNAVAGQPVGLRPTHMSPASDGNLYITYADTPGPSNMTDGAVWKYNTANGKWQDVTPLRLGENGKAGFGYAAVCVDPRNARHVVVTTHCLWEKGDNHVDEIFRSTDAGKSWKAIYKHGYVDDNSLAPYTKVAPLHWMFDIEIDPFNSEHAIFTTGFGGWETFNLSAVERKNEKVKWQIMSNGIEETVPLELYCPPSGAHLLTGIGDYGGFTYYDPTRPVETGANHAPSFGNTDGVCGAWHRPQLMLRCGNIFNHLTDDAPISYSEDGGKTWTACNDVPGETKPGEKGEPEHGHVAMSADGTTWVWTPERKLAAYTSDKGETWTPCQGLPHSIKVIADKEDDNLFYAVDVRRQTLYISKDAARTFQGYKLCLNLKNHSADARTGEDLGDIRGGQDRVYSIPGHSGQLWLAAYDGLYFIDIAPVLTSSDSMVNMTPKSHVRLITGFGIGKAAEGNDYPTLFLIGVVDGQYGIFRSVDNALSWFRINDDEHQFGKLLHIAGDMQDFGRVYIGTHGRGTIMGVEK
ncbi:MAG: exo-alpha-sialidase [Bacteroidales bacterium]|nr:exo-alpha-sialidase [Bacteroidales bacterium]